MHAERKIVLPTDVMPARRLRDARG